VALVAGAPQRLPLRLAVVAAFDSGYRERPPRLELRDYLACVWSLRPARRHEDAILPDGCMDIVWRPGVGVEVAGTDTGPVPVTRVPGRTVLGVRFRPGAAPAILGLPASELRDLRVPLAELWGSDAERLQEEIAVASSAADRQRLLQRALSRRLAGAERPDAIVAGAVDALRANGLRRVDGLGEALGISERQLRRRFHAAVGYGPKTLARVLRFQRMLALSGDRNGDGLALLALEAGYADQAHMTAECTRLAGQPPARLLASRVVATASD
jgi:AraC-like DNA-binding protein